MININGMKIDEAAKFLSGYEIMDDELREKVIQVGDSYLLICKDGFVEFTATQYPGVCVDERISVERTVSKDNAKVTIEASIESIRKKAELKVANELEKLKHLEER